jgi:CDP-glycerol glycerophosphotransferase (TagB/SpsB family)
VRTTPDISDQGRELVRALERRGGPPVSWLADDPTGPLAAGLPGTVLPSRSWSAVWAYWRARVVVHTHGVYGSGPGSRRKRFVNLWHGMPVKRLDAGSDVGRFQTDVAIATAPVHAEHLAQTWGIPVDRFALTGLPRNDLLVRPRTPLPPALAELLGDRPLVVWLPTFRQSVRGQVRADGTDLGTVTQFAEADPGAVDEAMARLGAHCLIKAHPLAERPATSHLPGVTVWSNHEMEAAGLTLYELLAHADVLITDHSSVWIDFLLTQRPIVFAISDREDYEASRGYYFSDLDALLPGPIAEDMAALEAELGKVLVGDDAWVERRRTARREHHVHTDAGSADRVAALVADLLDPNAR